MKVKDTVAIDPSIKLTQEGVIGLIRLAASEGHRVRARSDAPGLMHLALTRSLLLPRDGPVVRPRWLAPRAPPGTVIPVIALNVKVRRVSTPECLGPVVIW